MVFKTTCISPILPHVHFRGKEYPHHNFLQIGFDNAMKVKAAAVLEMPNPNPNLIDENSVKARLEESKQYRGDIYHGFHMGLTNDLEQCKNAFRLANERRSNIVGVKAFWVHSTGNMGILDYERQKDIWKAAKDVEFKGVFFQHCQDESMFRGRYIFDSPITHSHYQTKWSELYSLMTQVRNARDSGFEGIFYAAHVSTPEGIEFLNDEKHRRHPFEIIIETTGHHEFLNYRDYLIHGNGVKMNPALRERRDQIKVLEYVINGMTDIAGDDHAAHPSKLKINPPAGKEPPSGIPAIPFLPKRIETWRSLGMPEKQVERLLFHTANRIFGLGLSSRQVTIEYSPSDFDPYGYNPFSRVYNTQQS